MIHAATLMEFARDYLFKMYCKWLSNDSEPNLQYEIAADFLVIIFHCLYVFTHFMYIQFWSTRHDMNHNFVDSLRLMKLLSENGIKYLRFNGDFSSLRNTLLSNHIVFLANLKCKNFAETLSLVRYHSKWETPFLTLLPGKPRKALCFAVSVDNHQQLEEG